MKLTFPQVIPAEGQLRDFLRTVIEELTRFATKNIEIVNNLQVADVSVSSTGAANVEFTVTHNLGKTPVVYIVNVDKGGIIYDSRRTDWDGTSIYAKCSATGAAARFLLFA